MIRTFLIGTLLFVVFAVAFAPASLVRTLVPAEADLQVLETTGTLWHGSGDLLVGSRSTGQLDWHINPAALMQGALGYDVSLRGPEHHLQGAVNLGVRQARIALGGDVSGAFVNRWLAPYDIVIGGDLDAQNVTLELPYDPGRLSTGRAAGQLAWTGGTLRYRLGGRNLAGQLPPLVAYLGEGLEGVVYPEGGQTPLLHLAVLENGFVRVGVTKMMTRLAGNPWPGSHADHETVVEVEQQLF